MLPTAIARIALVLSAVAYLTACRPEAERRPETVVFLVRHAEKVDDSRDPELSGQGQARAARLAAFLTDARIDRVLSTDFIRTRETARPVAERLGLDIELYEDVAMLAESLRSAAETQRVLVVGHSNTTPELVDLLGGDAGEPIEDDEYDRFYMVSFPPGPPGPPGTTGSGGAATTVLFRLPGPDM